jgi:hypothetical protein
VKKLKASADPEQAIVARLVEGMASVQEEVASLKREVVKDRGLDLSAREFRRLKISGSEAVVPGGLEVYLPPKTSSRLWDST